MPGDRFSGGRSAALNSVSCIGTENGLGNCSFDRTNFDDRCEIASVVCQGIFNCVLAFFTLIPLFSSDPSTTKNADCSDNNVQLVNGSRSDLLDGRVEVCINRAWGTVCSEGFNDEDAQVVCGSFKGSGECILVFAR